jgi:hypothetical protein
VSHNAQAGGRFPIIQKEKEEDAGMTTRVLAHAAGLAAMAGAAVQAASLPIANADFETPQIPAASSYYSYSPGWGPSAGIYSGSTMLFTTNVPSWSGGGSSGIIFHWGTLPPTNGNNAAWVSDWIEQTLPTNFTAETTYILASYVGWRTDLGSPSPALNLYWKPNASTYNLVTPVSSTTPALVRGKWVLWTRTYNLPPGDPAVGKAITVLMGCSGSQTAFDVVSLTGPDPAPPSGTVVLLR